MLVVAGPQATGTVDERVPPPLLAPDNAAHPPRTLRKMPSSHRGMHMSSTDRNLRRIVVGVIIAGLLPLVAAGVSQADEEWIPSQIQPTDPPLNWSRATTDDQAAVDKFGRRLPVNPDVLTFFLACEKDTQLDCIESFGLVDSDGTYVPGAFTRATTEVRDLEGVGPVAWHSTFWDVPGLTADGTPLEVRLDGHMGSNEAAPGLVGMQMGSELTATVPPPAGSPDDLFGCIPGPRPGDYCAKAVVIPEDVTLRLVFRTSWISPAIVRARMKGADLGLESLGKGAFRWTLTGNAMLGQSFTVNPDGEERPAWVSTTFDFYVWDPRIYTELDSDCYAKGPILYSFNGMTGGQPHWSPQRGRLDINIGSLHHWPDGKTPWRGYYQTSIPEDTARCLWGIDPRRTSSVSLEVYDDNGESKAATVAIGFRNGKVNIVGFDFTYSEARMSVKVTVKKGSRCFARHAQVRNLVCTQVIQGGKKVLVWAPRKG